MITKGNFYSICQTLCYDVIQRKVEGKMNQQKINHSGNQKNWSLINDTMRGGDLTIWKIEKPFVLKTPLKYNTASGSFRKEEIRKREKHFEATYSEMWIG